MKFIRCKTGEWLNAEKISYFSACNGGVVLAYLQRTSNGECFEEEFWVEKCETKEEGQAFLDELCRKIDIECNEVKIMESL